LSAAFQWSAWRWAPNSPSGRVNLAGLRAEIYVATFEEWEGEPGAFELVYAATAWHWIDPAIRYRKAHVLLRPGGHLAFWSAQHAFPAGFDPFFAEIQEVYDAIGESHPGEWPPPPPEQIPDEAPEIEASGLFEEIQVRRYVWEKHYTAEEYITLLNTLLRPHRDGRGKARAPLPGDPTAHRPPPRSPGAAALVRHSPRGAPYVLGACHPLRGRPRCGLAAIGANDASLDPCALSVPAVVSRE